MQLLLFKLILPPLLILAATLAGRRWGDAIGGWLVGLPLTSGPVAVFLALQYGPDFAAAATNGSLVGTAAQAAFSLAYATLSGWGASFSLLAAALAYAATALALQAAPWPHGGFFLAALAALALALWLIPRRDAPRAGVAAPRWDLPARMIVATALVLSLTWAASFLGPRAAGALASFPVFGATLTVFAHKTRGPAMASEVLRGMVFALYGFAAFFYVLGALLPVAGVPLGFAAATGAALVVQSATLAVIRAGLRRRKLAPMGN